MRSVLELAREGVALAHEAPVLLPWEQRPHIGSDGQWYHSIEGTDVVAEVVREQPAAEYLAFAATNFPLVAEALEQAVKLIREHSNKCLKWSRVGGLHLDPELQAFLDRVGR